MPTECSAGKQKVPLTWGAPGGSCTHGPAPILLQPLLLLPDFGILGPEKKLDEDTHMGGVPCPVPDVLAPGCHLGVPRQGPQPQCWARCSPLYGRYLPILHAVTLALFALWTRRRLNLDLSLPSLSAQMFASLSDCGVNNFNVIFCVSLHLDENHCMFHAFLCVDS